MREIFNSLQFIDRLWTLNIENIRSKLT